MNIRVAARQACGLQFSGRVRANIRDQAGRDGMTLNILGRGPDLYFDMRRPTLTLFGCYSKMRSVLSDRRTCCKLQPPWDRGPKQDPDILRLIERGLVDR